MENDLALFPLASSSYQASHIQAPILTSTTMLAEDFHKTHGNLNYWGPMKEENMNSAPSSSNLNRVSQAGTSSVLDGVGNCSESRKVGKKVKKPRFAFQTRSQVDVLDDGYRWRKYGQKAVKNNRFPRSYYKCTHLGCNVKKQVQRHTKDEGIVLTTYEGVHTHEIEKSKDNFEQILSQMQIYPNF